MSWTFDSLSAPLAIEGAGVVEDAAPLTIDGGPETYNCPLFAAGSESDSASLPLYTSGVPGEMNSSISLYTKNWNSALDDLHGMNLFIKQSDAWIDYHTALSWMDGTTPSPLLFIGGSAGTVLLGHVPLIVQNNSGSLTNSLNPLSLFISGPHPLDSIISASTPLLFTSGDDFKPFIHPLAYIYLWAGSTRCETMGLFLQADPIPTLPFSMSLLVGGGNRTGNFAIVPLNIIGSEMGRFANLVIKGKDSGGTSSILRFIMTGGNPSLVGNVPMSVYNDYLLAENDTPFFVKGDGLNMNYVPANSSVSFHVQRGPQNGITLVMWNLGSTGIAPLYVRGAPNLTNSLPIFISGFGDELNLTAPLAVVGDVFTGVSNNCTLVMPVVYGFTPDSAYLYTNGFHY